MLLAKEIIFSLNVKTACIICFPIQYVRIFQSYRRMLTNIPICGINLTENGFLLYGEISSVRIPVVFRHMSIILIYKLVFNPA